jgi:hypothetical protein
VENENENVRTLHLSVGRLGRDGRWRKSLYVREIVVLRRSETTTWVDYDAMNDTYYTSQHNMLSSRCGVPTTCHFLRRLVLDDLQGGDDF